jgi:uroporphyrinogen-III synthase
VTESHHPRVAITTTSEDFKRVSQAFVEVDLEPVSLPCISIEQAAPAEVEAMRVAAGIADIMVVTSRRAIEILWPDGGMPATPVAAVGPATAHVVTDAGGGLAFVGSGGGVDLIELITFRLTGAVVAYPHARRADPVVGELLRQRATLVHSCVLYDTIPIPPATEPVDVVTFASPSAVDGWSLTRGFDALVLAIGSATRATLEQRGHPPDLVADTPTFQALARTIDRHYRSNR